MAGSTDNIGRSFSNSASISTSPTSTFHSPVSYHYRTHMNDRVPSKQLKPFATEDIKILLLENINQTARDILTKQGYQVEFLKTSLQDDQLIEKIRYVTYIQSFGASLYQPAAEISMSLVFAPRQN